MHEGALYERLLDDGREIVVYQMIFTSRVCIGAAGDPGYDDAWCYEDQGNAILAAATWDGKDDPPFGWHRHIGSGRRRPNGDPAKEYVEH